MSFFTPNPALFGMRVAKYIRCSHEDQVLHGDTLEAQNMILNDFIRVNKMVLIDTFIDEAFTARKSFNKRKEFVRLLNGVRAHDFEMIIFTKLDRWFRNIADYHKIQEILEANNVQWKAVTENYETNTTNGRLHINIRLSVAQDECDRDSDRIKDVFAYKLKNKTYISGSLPRGLMLDKEKHVIIDPVWTCFALDMYDHYEATVSKRGTQIYLQDKYNIRVCYDTVSRYLANPLFKGQYRDDPNFCEPTISPERWDRIQQLSKRNVPVRKNKEVYIFSGLLVCGTCGHAVVGTVTQEKLKSGETKVYKYYKCRAQYEAVCDRGESYREKYIEDYVLSHVRPALADYAARYEVSSCAGDTKKNPADEIAKIERKMKKLYDLFMDDLIDKEQYRKEYNGFKEEIESLSKAPVVACHDISNVKKLLDEDWESVYRTFNNNEKNAFWKSFIDKIVINKDRSMDIIFL